MTQPPVVALALSADMPAAGEVIEWMRAQLAEGMTPETVRAEAVTKWHPLDQVAPVAVLAQWLGQQQQTVQAAMSRTRADGSRLWPEPEPDVPKVGRASLWRFSAIALNRATSPGRGWNFRTATPEGS
jgi:hypothetical protein